MPAGRPSKIDPVVVGRILSFLRAGDYLETAALAAGITKVTLYNWLRRGASPKLKKDGQPYASERPFIEFLYAVEKARAEADQRDLEIIDDAARGGQIRTITKRKYIRITDDDGNEQQVLSEEIIEEREAVPEWQAAAWKLERRNPSRFARRAPKLIEPDDIEFSDLSDEQLQRLANGEDIDAVLQTSGGGRTRAS